MLQPYRQRVGLVAGQLQTDDVEAGIAAYQKQLINLDTVLPANDEAGTNVKQ